MPKTRLPKKTKGKTVLKGARRENEDSFAFRIRKIRETLLGRRTPKN